MKKSVSVSEGQCLGLAENSLSLEWPQESGDGTLMFANQFCGVTV